MYMYTKSQEHLFSLVTNPNLQGSTPLAHLVSREAAYPHYITKPLRQVPPLVSVCRINAPSGRTKKHKQEPQPYPATVAPSPSIESHPTRSPASTPLRNLARFALRSRPIFASIVHRSAVMLGHMVTDVVRPLPLVGVRTLDQQLEAILF